MKTAATGAARDSRAGILLLLSVLLVGGMLLSVTGCNTVEGAGEDMQSAGEAMSDTADDDESGY
jgi:predicted small secreted protein